MVRGRKPTNRSADFEDLQALAQQEDREITAEDIEKTLIPESLKQHKYSVKLWIEFSDRVLRTPLQEDNPFPQPPTAKEIMLFLTWYTRTSHGLIEEKINDTTVANRLRCLKRAIRLFTNHVYSKADNSQIALHIEKELPRTENLSTMAYNKPVAPLNVSKDVIRFLWACDEHDFQHPRIPLQLAFAILLMTVMGMRPGEIIESSNWKGSNEGLLYRDVKLLRSAADGTFMLHVQLRNRKGHRHNHKQGALMLLTEEPEDRALCPVNYFLSHALADGVFEGCKTLSDLKAVKPSPGSSYCEFPYHRNVGDLPILRSPLPDGSISPTKILTYDGFHWMIRNLGQRAGYKDKLTAYCFRRGYGNSIDKCVTAAQRQQLMGHANDSIFQSYISSMIGIDSQSVIFGREQRTELIGNHSSMMLHRNLLAPMPPRSQLAELNRSLNDSDFSYDQRKCLERAAFKVERQEFFQGESTTTSSRPTDGTRIPSRYLKTLLKYDLCRKKAVMLMYPDIDLDVNEHDQDDDESPDRDNCEPAGTMESTQEPRGVPLDQIVGPLQSMAQGHKQFFKYGGAETIEKGCCSFCKKRLEGERLDRVNTHLLFCAKARKLRDGENRTISLFENTRLCRWNDCYYKFVGKNAEAFSLHMSRHVLDNKSYQCLWGPCRESYDSPEALSCHVTENHGVSDGWTTPTNIRYCFEHSLWCSTNSQWDAHLKKNHLLQLNDFCGLIQRNGVVLVGGNCLFCIGNTGACLGIRFNQFLSERALRNHMEKHLKDAVYPFECPHPSCSNSLDTADLFWKHALSAHGIEPPPVAGKTGKRKSPCEDGPQQE